MSHTGNRHASWPELLAAVGVVAGLVGLVVLALAYPQDPVAYWDETVARRVAEDMPRPVEWAARPVTWVGGAVGLVLLGLVVGVALGRRRAWADLCFLGATVLGTQVLVLLLKAAFDRPRPDVAPVIRLPSSASFPSGHAAGGLAFFAALAVLAHPRMRTRRSRYALVVGAALLAGAIGASRVILGVHYVSDVLAGWCFGLAWLGACVLGRRLIATPSGQGSSNLAA